MHSSRMLQLSLAHGGVSGSSASANMVFTQGRGIVFGALLGMQIRSLHYRVLVCHAADTASLATWFVFGKLFVLRRFSTSERSGVVKTFRCAATD